MSHWYLSQSNSVNSKLDETNTVWQKHRKLKIEQQKPTKIQGFIQVVWNGRKAVIAPVSHIASVLVLMYV